MVMVMPLLARKLFLFQREINKTKQNKTTASFVPAQSNSSSSCSTTTNNNNSNPPPQLDDSSSFTAGMNQSVFVPVSNAAASVDESIQSEDDAFRRWFIRYIPFILLLRQRRRPRWGLERRVITMQQLRPSINAAFDNHQQRIPKSRQQLTANKTPLLGIRRRKPVKLWPQRRWWLWWWRRSVEYCTLFLKKQTATKRWERIEDVRILLLLLNTAILLLPQYTINNKRTRSKLTRGGTSSWYQYNYIYCSFLILYWLPLLFVPLIIWEESFIWYQYTTTTSHCQRLLL